MNIVQKRILLSSAASLLATSWTAPVLAQDASTAEQANAKEDDAAARAGVGEIVVTARRTSESIQKVPISISAFSAEMLEAKNLDDIADVARNTPNVQLDPV